ncbi:MAG: putative toxin, partial [Lysobacteraceae bacterium]
KDKNFPTPDLTKNSVDNEQYSEVKAALDAGGIIIAYGYNGPVVRLPNGVVVNSVTGAKSRNPVSEEYFNSVLSDHDVMEQQYWNAVHSGRTDMLDYKAHKALNDELVDIKLGLYVEGVGSRKGELDEFGQPLHGRSNYNAINALGNIWGGNEGVAEKIGKTWRWANYTVPDREVRYAERMERESRDPTYQLDQLANSPVGAIAYDLATIYGADERQKQIALDVGSTADAFISGAGGRRSLRVSRTQRRMQIPLGNSNVSSGIDFGPIPVEHQLRYERYLQRPSARKLDPAAWYEKAKIVWANNRSGNSFEKMVREWIGTPIGKGSKPVSIDGFIPDLPVGKRYGVTDIKNVESLSRSPQLVAFFEYAKINKLPFNLIIGPNTKYISAPLLNDIRSTGGGVKFFDMTSKKMYKVDIGNEGNWRK